MVKELRIKGNPFVPVSAANQSVNSLINQHSPTQDTDTLHQYHGLQKLRSSQQDLCCYLYLILIACVWSEIINRNFQESTSQCRMKLLGGPIPRSGFTGLLKHREQVDTKSGGNSLSMAGLCSTMEWEGEQQQQQYIYIAQIVKFFVLYVADFPQSLPTVTDTCKYPHPTTWVTSMGIITQQVPLQPSYCYLTTTTTTTTTTMSLWANSSGHFPLSVFHWIMLMPPPGGSTVVPAFPDRPPSTLTMG